MKILITGASGFIGSHLVNYFVRKGDDVVGCVIKNTESKSKELIVIDPNLPDFGSLFRDKLFDFCINASGSASVPFSITNPLEDFRLNVGNVNLILHAIRNENPSCGFINFSSAAVYGNPLSIPINETMQSSPLSPYGFHKMISEQICCEFYKLYNIHTASLRVFSAYGPGLKKQLFWDLYKKVNSGEKIELFGTGNESRDFIYISDLCLAVDAILTNSPLNGEVINVSSGEETTINTAVKAFIQEYNPKLQYNFTGEEKKGDPTNWRADISMLKQLGFKPKVSFNNGIKQLVNWLKCEM